MFSSLYSLFIKKSVFLTIKSYQKGLDLILPPRCSSCGEVCSDHHKLCADCWNQLSFLSSPQCPSCGWPLPFTTQDILCGSCLQTPLPYEGWSIFSYQGLIRQLILRFKHGDATYLAPTLARFLLTGNLKRQKTFQSCDYLIPVPLHRWRMVKRQYNQATLLSRELSKLTCVPVQTDILFRKKHTQSQHLKSRKQRRDNVKDVFVVQNEQILQGKTVCLIDDVWTTGSTLKNCAYALKKGGAKKIYALSLARVIPD